MMSSLSNSNHHSRLLANSTELHSLPTIWPFRRVVQERGLANPRILTENDPLPDSRRLVVILPDFDFDLFSLPRQLWKLAAPDCRAILLLLRPDSQENELHAQMNLTTLAAIIRDSRVVVQTQLVLGMPLDQAVLQSAGPDDVVVCFEEHLAPSFLDRKQRLADRLALKTRLPVYTLKGTISKAAQPAALRLIDFALLAVCLAIIAGFFAIGVWIDQNSTGTTHILLEILAAFAEVWILSVFATRSFRI